MIDLNSIVCGDCMSELSLLPDDCVKLVFADPPYNTNMSYHTYNDNIPQKDYAEWCRKWFKECRRIAERVIITPGHGNLWMWGDIEIPWGVGSWFKPGNPSSSVLGWCCWEPWLYYCKDYKALGGPDSWRIPVSKQPDTGSHPCPKPLELLEKLIVKTTKEGDIVLDPFCGSGTTCLAAKKWSRQWIGIEIDPIYVARARMRLNALVDLME